MPIIDPRQDVTLLRGSKNNTHIIVAFQRKRITCDSNDMPLTV